MVKPDFHTIFFSIMQVLVLHIKCGLKNKTSIGYTYAIQSAVRFEVSDNGMIIIFSDSLYLLHSISNVHNKSLL